MVKIYGFRKFPLIQLNPTESDQEDVAHLWHELRDRIPAQASS